MTALDFPTSPSNGDTYQNYVYDSTAGVWKRFTAGLDLNDITDVTLTSPTDGQALVYDNATSSWINGDTAGGVEIASTAPSSPSAGDLWWDSDNGNLYVYYDDGTSQQWVSASDGQATISDTAPAGYNGQLWWNSTEGKMYVYYDDGTSAQWVAAGGPQVTVQATAPTGYQGQMWLDSTDGSMYVYYTDPGGGSSSWIGAVSRSGGILQVVSTTKTDTYSSNFASNSFDTTVVPGLSASITPRSTSSKILVRVQLHGTQSTLNYAITNFRIERDGTPIGVGDAAGSRPSLTASSVVVVNDPNATIVAGGEYLDSPSTTSTVTYGVRLFNHNSTAATFYVNRTVNDSNDRNGRRPVSTITLMEIAG